MSHTRPRKNSSEKFYRKTTNWKNDIIVGNQSVRFPPTIL